MTITHPESLLLLFTRLRSLRARTRDGATARGSAGAEGTLARPRRRAGRGGRRAPPVLASWPTAASVTAPAAQPAGRAHRPLPRRLARPIVGVRAAAATRSGARARGARRGAGGGGGARQTTDVFEGEQRGRQGRLRVSSVRPTAAPRGQNAWRRPPSLMRASGALLRAHHLARGSNTGRLTPTTMRSNAPHCSCNAHALASQVSEGVG